MEKSFWAFCGFLVLKMGYNDTVGLVRAIFSCIMPLKSYTYRR
jgi:hypothetical protein